jgi:mannose-6-phosphate isomerase-like protein (cupin superfamily)
MAMQKEPEEKAKEKVDELADTTPMSVGDPVATAAVASVLFAWYNFYIRGEKQPGIFVGLWAPPMLAAAVAEAADDAARIVTHEHEQAGFLYAGTLVFIIDGEEIVLEPEDSYVVPSQVPHAVENRGDEAVKGIDIFSPPRVDVPWA